MTAKMLMLMGSMSSVGKSLLTAGFCRIFTRKGLRVLPFKAQNMSNNAAVCLNGGEIGRAQAVQAAAAGVQATVQMNPVLLKPEADHKSQLILLGKLQGSFSGTDYYAMRNQLWQPITESLESLRSEADLVLIEGAGSIAELNLLKNDVTNLAIARYAKAPCLLIGDIDRGGIFAQLAGSWWLLSEADRKFIRGFIVNKFRGEIKLFSEGTRILSERSDGTPVAGVVPYLPDHGIADEDAAAFSSVGMKSPAARKICVVKLLHISNFDDFDPLKYEPMVNLVFCDRPDEMRGAAAILLPGTKNTLGDMQWLVQSGMADAIQDASRQGAAVVGICGGFQLMGEQIRNPLRLESGIEACAGLGLLPVETVMAGSKKVSQTEMQLISVSGFLNSLQGLTVQGYEIHYGETQSTHPIFKVKRAGQEKFDGFDGAIAADGKSFGTYLHGLFDNDGFRSAWLRALDIEPSGLSFRTMVSQSFDRLADHLEEHLDIALIEQIIDQGIS